MLFRVCCVLANHCITRTNACISHGGTGFRDTDVSGAKIPFDACEPLFKQRAALLPFPGSRAWRAPKPDLDFYRLYEWSVSLVACAGGPLMWRHVRGPKKTGAVCAVYCVKVQRVGNGSPQDPVSA